MMNEKQNGKKIVFAISGKEIYLAMGIMLLLFLGTINLFVLLNMKANPVYNEPPLLEVNVIYQGENISEIADILDYNLNRETGLLLAGTNDFIYVRFDNLSVNNSYSLDRAGYFDYKFTNTTRITFLMRVYEDNWCYLSTGTKDLIWVWIGTIGQ